MSFQFTLQKVMELREREKETVQSEYEQAVQTFEITATELYKMLKKKEELEEDARRKVAAGTSIFSLQQKQNKLLQLQQEIQLQQHHTHLARERMNKKQEDLLQKSIEYKKYEKLKQVQKDQYEQEAKRLEFIQMDELSIRLYANKEKWVSG